MTIEIEKQKTELEHLRQMQNSFNRGKVEMTDNLQHAITLLERERLDAEQRILQYTRAQSIFNRTLEDITKLNPDDSSHAELHSQLEIAGNVIDDAREEYVRTLKHLDSLNSSDELSNTEKLGEFEKLKKGEHTLKVVVKDKLNNETTFTQDFYY